MFTGIVEEVGEILEVTQGADSAVLRVRGPLVVSDATHGASIAVGGVCLTVTDLREDAFSVDVMRESLERSALGDLRPGSRVNLERAVRADGRLGGHIVQGHVDGTGVIAAREPGDRWEVVTIELPEQLAKYVVEKGSIAVDGVSLTVSALVPGGFCVSLIPTTLEATTLGAAAVGDRVNLEVDVLAKYVERLLVAGELPAQGGSAQVPA
ncbi:riboflavin synthase [Kineosphaera limosa]|uniref:Riboflavin synthase n=1 Tax=Kineosphaera limosa NBRC 100340 TaxID=1184609 RepID=K6WB95_9MICO|nr:riboflavin synthase [Kineosphaera limosa]NYD99135.1 riboflavin synthase [Kineosphaera limosa]GAB96505.1 riboflavin synthase alpha chain [Kineosphaera limosa NBRC 100340]